MPIQGINQPEIIQIDKTLRLRKYDGKYDFALPWYQNIDTVFLVDGKKRPYTLDRVLEMYDYLDCHGELYFIEILTNEVYFPIGDVTFSQTDMPIVIGDSKYRNYGIGSRVISALIDRGRSLGFSSLYVEEIYDYNEASQKCFMKNGFVPYEKTEKGRSYRLSLDK